MASIRATASSVSGVGAALVGAEQDEIALALVGGQSARAAGRRPRGGPDRRPALMRRDSDGSTSTAGQWSRAASSRESIDVTVEDAAHLVGDRLVHVAAGDEHGVKRR